VVEQNGSGKLTFVTGGTINFAAKASLPSRLLRVYDELRAVMAKHQPDVVAIEDVFYSVNAKSALKLGQVRGAALLAVAASGLEVAEYAPLSIKAAVVGYGRAEKSQVQHMVKLLLELDSPPESPDAADALAVAICHLHSASTVDRQRSFSPAR
jgi:crossover junction endodeoxyribonuclease RuvC